MLEQRTFGELVAAWQDCNRDFDCFAYPGQHEGQGEFKYYTATDLGNLTRNAAEHFVSQGLQPRQEGERPLVVAIFALGTPEWAVGDQIKLRLSWSANYCMTGIILRNRSNGPYRGESKLAVLSESPSTSSRYFRTNAQADRHEPTTTINIRRSTAGVEQGRFCGHRQAAERPAGATTFDIDTDITTGLSTRLIDHKRQRPVW